MSADHLGQPDFETDEIAALASLGRSAAAWRPSDHPDPALVIALDEGVLDETVAARVRAHASACVACRRMAADLVAVWDTDAVRESRARVDSRVGSVRQRPRRPLWFWLVPAGGLAVAAGLAWMMLTPGTATPPVPDAQMARLEPPVLPTVFIAGRPDIPLGDVDLTVRGDTTSRVNVLNAIAAALDDADSKDPKAALSALEAIVRAHPDSRYAGLALGAVQLRADRNADALTTLERARQQSGDAKTADELDWFQAIAFLRTGNRSGARALIEGLCYRPGPRNTRACAGLLELDRSK